MAIVASPFGPKIEPLLKLFRNDRYLQIQTYVTMTMMLYMCGWCLPVSPSFSDCRASTEAFLLVQLRLEPASGFSHQPGTNSPSSESKD